jgi:phosphomannomutase/phosphoglucomutase
MLFAEDVLTRNPGAAIIYDVKCTGQSVRSTCAAQWRQPGHVEDRPLADQGQDAREEDSRLAGEMSGHFFFGERWYGFDDGIYAAARLMEILPQR